MNESLKFNIEVLILVLQDMAMGTEGIDFTLNIIVSIKEVSVVESQVVLFFSSDIKLIINGTHSVLSFKHLSSEVSVACILCLSLSSEVRFMSKLSIKISLKSMALSIKS